MVTIDFGRAAGRSYRFRVDTQNVVGKRTYKSVDVFGANMADAWNIFLPWLGAYVMNLDATKTVVRVRLLAP